ncbi:MAG: GAF domain-containing protein [Gammaproteobacteria bacterium]|nr:GAF domain-containing protein [Gammaproteobacteria bacterium]
MEQDIDLIQSVFQHRLRQTDLDRILTALSATERDELVSKIGDLLRHISALVDVSNKISDTLALDVLLPRLMEIITESLGADRSTLFLHDPDSDELFSHVAQGDAVGEIRIPAGAGIAGSVFRSGKAVIIHDAYEDDRFNPEVDRKTGYRTRNILCNPIHNKGKAIGVTQVLNKDAGDFDGEDLRLLEALTSQAASALENARLYEKVERARQEEAQLLEVTNAIASELQLDTLLAKIIQATTHMLGADRSTLFMYDPRSHELWSRVAEGMDTREIRFPAAAGIAGACFTGGETINIPDAYADPRFNPAVDRKTGYKTRSILCLPVISKDGRKLAVIQVLNKKTGPFGATDERRLRAFCAQVAIALENAQLFDDVLNERNYNESILISLSNGVVTLDTELRIIKANGAALGILHRQDDDPGGRSLDAVIPVPLNEWLYESITRVRKDGQVDMAVDAELRLADDCSTSVNLNVVPLVDIKRTPLGYMLVMEDITREKRVRSTMARYLTKEVADQLLESGEEQLGGITREATVLFSDIRRFTTLSEELGARATVTLLNEYFTHMVDIIFSHGGILDKYIGDAIMAVFGTPFPAPDDAANAMRVANEMMRTLARFNAGQVAQGKMAINIGIGVSSGELVAGNIGSAKRMDYTVIGDTVNLAARLESATKVYGVDLLMCEFTARALDGGSRYRELDLIRVKGQSRPVAVFESLDYLPPERADPLDKALAAFERGVALYRQGAWQRAMAAFTDVLERCPWDGPSRMYMERCTTYMAQPPPADWGGVWTMMSK